MNIDKELKKVRKLYSENIVEKGPMSQAVGWNSQECQNLRFRKLSRIIEDPKLSFSINDYGCGFGSHLIYLKEIEEANVTKYNGYDISGEMICEAKKQLSRFNIEKTFIESNSVSTTADYSFVSGTFNVKFEADEEQWIKFIEKTTNEIFEHSNKAFAFNLLTSYVDYKEPHLYYADPLFWFDYCKKNFSKYVSLLHDYELWEWTILVKKGS